MGDLAGKKVLVEPAAADLSAAISANGWCPTGPTSGCWCATNSRGLGGWLDYSDLRGEMDIRSGDIRDHNFVRRITEGRRIVFHLASLIAIPYSYHAPASYVDTNVTGALNVLGAALEHGAEMVVHTSTSEVYGTAQYAPMDEDHPLQAQSPYSATKIAADKLAESFWRSFDLPVVTVRPFNTFGPRQSDRAVIPATVIQALTRGEIHLGSLAPTRDFNYVADTVDGFVKAATASEAVGQVVNLGSGKEISIGDMAKMVLELLGKDLPIITEGRARPPG